MEVWTTRILAPARIVAPTLIVILIGSLLLAHDMASASQPEGRAVEGNRSDRLVLLQA